MKQILGLVLWVALAFAAGLVGSFFQPGEWYRSLLKPALTPPGWVFGPVWTALYLMMGVAAWTVWKRGGFGAYPLALSAFMVQLALNAMWTWLFFGMHRIGLALVDILLLDIAIASTLALFWRAAPSAGLLLIPYLGWTLFATLLNFGFWRLNVQG